MNQLQSLQNRKIVLGRTYTVKLGAFEILVLFFFLIFLSACLFPTHNVFAVTSITWDSGNGGSHSIFDGAVNSGTTVTFTVTDTSLTGNGVTDKINVLVNSTSDPAGITLTLTETGDSGTFTNTNLIFTNGTGLFGISSSQTVGINKPSLNTDPNVIETIISGPANFEGMQIFSTTDTTGIFMNLTETGPNTGIFTNKLHFTTGPSINGSSISVNGGGIVSIQDVNNLDFTNELVIPNPDPALGALTARYGDRVDAVYNGAKESVFLIAGSVPGGGGGGLIRPGLVFDVLRAIGGSPYIVSPPSFGGDDYHYSDGLTLTQGTHKTIFDTTKYNQEIPTQVMASGQKVDMTFKTFESYNPTGVIHMGLYIIPRGQDMITTNSIGSIVYDKNSSVQVSDPNHILSSASASTNSDGKFQYFQFSFVPTKSYDKMSFLVRAWNDYMYSTDIRVHDAVVLPVAAQPAKIPDYMHVYASLKDADYAVESAGYVKPELFAHISNSDQVWSGSIGGNVLWFFDTKDKEVARIIYGNDGNMINEDAEKLVKAPDMPIGKLSSYSGNHLNRQNVDQMNNAKANQELLAFQMMDRLGYPIYFTR